MKRIGFLMLALVVSVYLFGCGKKQQTLEEMQEPMSIETLGATTLPGQTTAVEPKTPEVKPSVTAAPGLKPEAMSVPVSSKPTTEEIQTALKNAGFYTGNVDGKAGSMTKKAVEEFQKAHSLQADGKVGPKTWEALSKYLNAPVDAGKLKKNKKR